MFNIIIELFKDKYIQANKAGRNFFYGNYSSLSVYAFGYCWMIKDIEDIIKLFIRNERFIKTIDEYLNDQLNNPDKAEIFNKYKIDTNKKLI